MSKEENPIGELFQACDLDGSGFIDRQELAAICPDLTKDEVDNIFAELDGNGDGSISVAEFCEGFKSLSSSLMGLSRGGGGGGGGGDGKGGDVNGAPVNNNNDGDKVGSGGEDAWQTGEDGGDDRNGNNSIVNELTDLGVSVNEDLITTLSCQEQVCELYQNLHASSSPQLLSQFEDIILSVIKDIRQQQCENERLENSFKREKDKHTKQLQELEEEMENHVSEIEMRVRRQEREQLESEKENLKVVMEREIAEMQSNMSKLQKLETELQSQEKPNDELKMKVEELNCENRHLQSTLTDAMTQLAILRSETATVKQNYEEKCYELQSEKQTLEGYLKEQDNLSRQIHILHDANKKLHDTNDDLRSALDSSRTLYKRAQDTKTPSKPSLGQDYVKQYLSSPKNSTPLGNSSLADEMGMMEPSKRKLLPVQDSCEIDSLPEDFDSGHSTMPGGQELDSEYELSLGLEDENRYSSRTRHRLLRGNSGFDNTMDEMSDLNGAHTDLDTEIELGDEDDDLSVCSPGVCSNCSRTSSRASMRSNRSNRSSGSRRQHAIRRIPLSLTQTITKEPERMYKVVLAGDAAVGKSSFILRLCKNKFISNLNSTLGVDFQTKTIELDGRVIALQLWDTAGQERYRSIAQSYFRRSDGVLLMYSCTSEQSFLNVRHWVHAVQDSSDKKLPIMFMANKTDLREEFENDGRKCIKCVETEEGQRLAREYDGLFIETSAKHGDNILEAVTELARLMRANEDLEVQNVGLHLQEMDKGKKDNKLVNCCTL